MRRPPAPPRALARALAHACPPAFARALARACPPASVRPFARACPPAFARACPPALARAFARACPPAVARPITVALALAVALLGAGCGDDGKPSAGGAPSASAAAASGAAAVPSGRATAAAPATAVTPPDGVDLLKLVLTSGVARKDPVDVLDAAKPGQRVYGHVTVRNRTSGTKRVSISFRVNGDERSMVDLDVQKSWSWRTWAYVTLRKDDKGELTVHVFDDHGAELGTETIPIR